MGVNAYFPLQEQPDHMQNVAMERGNKMLKLIITDRNIVSLKTGSYTRKVGKIRSRSNV